jgi:hypothetical protein
MAVAAPQLDGWSAAGVLDPALAPLLRAVQELRVFEDSKTAV